MSAEIKILLVETNPINVVVIEETLDALGYKAAVANNGIQALEKLSTGASHYNIVLMACDMPKMDGYETTRLIRRGEGGIAHQSVPVIAMCSSAVKGLQDKCSSVGMNDYTVMPIEPEILGQKLSEWVKPMMVDKVSNIVNDGVSDCSELPIWDEEEVLVRMRGKKDRLIRLIEMFSKNLPQAMQELRESIEALDMNTAREKAHAIKGVAANISGQQLTALMKDCEDACIEGNVERVQEILPLGLVQSEQLLEKLRQYIN